MRTFFALVILLIAILAIALFATLTPQKRAIGTTDTVQDRIAVAPKQEKTLQTPFRGDIECNIVKIYETESTNNKSLYYWTDGTAGRRNYPIDIYIDTNDSIDWKQNETATILLTITNDTLFEKPLVINTVFSRDKLIRIYQNRGLFRLSNIGDINPPDNIIYKPGMHKIKINMRIDNAEYSGVAVFTVK